MCGHVHDLIEEEAMSDMYVEGLIEAGAMSDVWTCTRPHIGSGNKQYVNMYMVW